MYAPLVQQPHPKKTRRNRWFILTVVFALIVIYLIFFNIFHFPINVDRTLVVNTADIPSAPPFDHLIPTNSFDLFWMIWSTDQSTFRGRHLLALESLFIHHPQATVIMLSATLNDKQLFLPFRHRGYKIHSFNISLEHILRWKWYSNNQTKDFLQTWNSSDTYFSIHLTYYVRTIALYAYGGTYIDTDALILQPLLNEEFIGYDRTTVDEQCDWCIGNTSNLYIEPSVMRFSDPIGQVLQRILETTFNRQIYDPSCFECVGPIAYTQRITEDRRNNDPEVMNLKLLEPHRLYPKMWKDTSTIFKRVEQDTILELADLTKRSYSLHLFGDASDQLDVTRGSLIDRIFHRCDLGDLRPNIYNPDESNNDVRLICPSLYIYTGRKQGRFIGRDAIYLRLNQTFGSEDVRWKISISVSSGSVILPPETSLFNLNQAEINRILNVVKYQPDKITSTDTLMIDVQNENVTVSCSSTILVFSQWVTILTKTMGTSDRWSGVQRLVASIDRYFPQTTILIASDSGKTIDKTAFLSSTSSDNISGSDLSNTVVIYDLPEDSGLSTSRNYLLNSTTTPFFFLVDDDFEFEEDSHLDILLELIYTYPHIDIIAGKIPEDIRNYTDFSGIFLRYGQTLELVHDVSENHRDQMWFVRSVNDKLNDGNPCHSVDFVPNVFMARTESVRSTLWDENLKLGEHEDFFLRFGQAKRSVYTCRYINVHHHPVQWWEETNDAYYKKRDRVFEYLKKMLSKYHLKKLKTFGSLLVSVD